MVVDGGSAFLHGAAKGHKTAVLVRTVARVVPADEVEELVACREPDLAKAFVRLDARRQPDLISVRPISAPTARVVAIERTPVTEALDLLGKAGERVPDEEWARRHIQIGVRAPELIAQRTQVARGQNPLWHCPQYR